MPLTFPRRATGATFRAQSAADRQSWAGTLRFVAFLAIFALALRSLVAAPFSIPSGSMLPTLYIGDYLVVAKWPYGYSRYSFPFGLVSFQGRLLGNTPKRGDVVVFRHPIANSDLIKRVIGIPGDTIELRAGVVILNGRALPRQKLAPYRLKVSDNMPCRVVPPAIPVVAKDGDATFCVFPAFRESLPEGPSYVVFDQTATEADDFAPTIVPAGHVFLMGDNRDDSLDSRFARLEGGIGMVPAQNLIGRAAFTFWSTDGSASWFKPWTWFSASRFERIGNGYTATAR